MLLQLLKAFIALVLPADKKMALRADGFLLQKTDKTIRAGSILCGDKESQKLLVASKR
jgi:hypothetical protein